MIPRERLRRRPSCAFLPRGPVALVPFATDGCDGSNDLYEAFVQANQKYLEAVALEYQEGDVVLVHDYELMLLPAMIRGRVPDAPVGFFCHCPFPSSEYYRMLPASEALLRAAPSART